MAGWGPVPLTTDESSPAQTLALSEFLADQVLVFVGVAGLVGIGILIG